MKDTAAGAPPIDGATKIKTVQTASVPPEKRLRFKDFTGEIVVSQMKNGRVLVGVSHDDGHLTDFDPTDFGWQVT